MTRSYNRVMLIGNLGRDPELRYTPNGQAVANFSVATNEMWVNKDNERQTRTEWHRIVAWSKLAEFTSEYLSKGKQIFVEGRLRTRTWQDRNGNSRTTTEIWANSIILLGRKDDSLTSEAEEPQAVEEEISDDDIPF
jgi:single-strand DNA-binding protein